MGEDAVASTSAKEAEEGALEGKPAEIHGAENDLGFDPVFGALLLVVVAAGFDIIRLVPQQVGPARWS